MSDGGLRRLFRKHIPQVHWTTIESRTTESGIPDLNGCFSHEEFWIECKAAQGWQVTLRPMQIAWIKRRTRCGGNCWIAIRRRIKSKGIDQLILFRGGWIDILIKHGLRKVANAECKIPLGAYAFWDGGPSKWQWKDIHYKLWMG